jgi:subtilisin family serine protease
MAKKKASRPVSRAAATTKKSSLEAATDSLNHSFDDATIVYVHGIGAHPAPAAWKQKWDIALFGKSMGSQTVGAYWADILHGPPSTVSEKQVRSIENVSIVSVLEDLKIDLEHPDTLNYIHTLERELRISNDETLESTKSRSRRTGKKVVPLPQWLRTPIANTFMKWFVRDSAAYFLKPEIREEIKARVGDRIRAITKPFVVVAHSQGTVASFEVLSQRKLFPREDVSLFATLGSPLGIQEVQDNLIARNFELLVPEGVEQWHNFADRLDLVAADRKLGNDFKPSKENQVRIFDHLIINRNVANLTGINPHDSAGYLSHPEVRNVVYRAGRFDPNARFVVARDVAFGLSVPFERQPLLIEVLEPGYPAADESYDEMYVREQESDSSNLLEERVNELASSIEKIVKQLKHEGDPKIIPLRKYVAAHLTAGEIEALSAKHKELNIFSVWRSSSKSKAIYRSHSPINADAARNSYGAEGEGITWAVLDTGCNPFHPHFLKHNTILDVYDCTTKAKEPVRLTEKNETVDSEPKLADNDGHGTHVCGIIAGSGRDREDDRGKVYSGVAPRAKLIVFKVLDDQGNGEDAWIIKALDKIFRINENATSIKIHGINLSLGGPFDPTVYGCGFSPICMALRELWRQGVLICVAAGNEGLTDVATEDGTVSLNTSLSIGDPANLEDCIAVGSVHTDKPHLYGISYFSSRGPTSDGRRKPDLVAPGERIFSSDSHYLDDGSPTTKLYREDSGTSMACPHVSGLLAAFLSVRKEFRGRPDEVKRILLENCNDLGRDRYHQGAGIPNLHKMLLNT